MDSIVLEEMEQGLLENETNSKTVLPLDPVQPLDRELVADLYHYSIFGLAIYSHLLALYMQPVTGSCRLCYSRAAYAGYDSSRPVCGLCLLPCQSKPTSSNDPDSHTHECCYCCCCCCAPDTLRLSEEKIDISSPLTPPSHHHRDPSEWQDSPHAHSTRASTRTPDRKVIGDNCFRVNEAGMLHITKGRCRAELIYASFRNDTNCKPYAIFAGTIIIHILHVNV